MPNHVGNIVEFSGDKNRIQQMLETIKYDEYGIGSFDFNKLIPMPESLNITNGSETNWGIEIYLTAINPKTKDFGLEKMGSVEFNILVTMLNNERMFSYFNPNLSDERIATITENQPYEAYVQTGKTAVNNFRQYGATTWYEWRVRNWGTKWNAYEYEEGVDYSENDHIYFRTAWDAPRPVMMKLAEMFPDIKITHKWADEDDLGNNCGKIVYEGGIQTEEFYPEKGIESLKYACEVAGYDFAEYMLMISDGNCG